MPSGATFQGKKGSYVLRDEPFAFGRVSLLYEASDQRGDTVAVKLFRSSPTDLGGNNVQEEFARELSAQSKLSHPNILAIIDFNENRPFLVLPLCKGGDLRHFMRQKQFLPLAETISILRQVALAVDFAHESGFIHGDIKPENILLSEDQTRAFLCDFSMARYFAIAEKVTTARSEGGGSSSYLSPEQIDSGQQTPSSDIYSLATVAYEMLTGALPVDTSVPIFRQMEAKISGKLLDPARLNPTLPENVCTALMRGLSRQAANRPESAIRFCLDLSATVQNVKTGHVVESNNHKKRQEPDNKPDQKANALDFLSPASFIKAAQGADRNFRYAIIAAGILGIVVTFARFGVSFVTLIFGAIVLIGLMVVYVVFAQVPRLARSTLDTPAKALVWTTLLVVITILAGLTISSFINWPLPIRDWIAQRLNSSDARAKTEKVSPPDERAPDPPGIHYFSAYLNLLSGVSEYSINLYVDGHLAGTFTGDNKTRSDGITSSVVSLGPHNYYFTGQLKMDDSTYSAYGSGTISITRDGDTLEADQSDAAPVAGSNLWFSVKNLN